MPKYLTTFCNCGKARLAVIEDGRVSRVLDLDTEALKIKPSGLTGIAPYGAGFVVATQSNPSALLFLGPHLTIETAVVIPEARDLHGLAVHGDDILVVSTGNSQILKFNPQTRHIAPFWFGGPSLSDTIHLNDIAVVGDAIYCAEFGMRLPDELRAGRIVEVQSGAVLGAGLREPHSIYLHEGGLYVLESATGDLIMFREGFAPQRILGVVGYPRGLAINATHFAIGKSGFRAEARNRLGDDRLTPIANNDAVGEELRRSGVFLVSRTTYQTHFIDMSTIAAEIYQVLEISADFPTEPELTVPDLPVG